MKAPDVIYRLGRKPDPWAAPDWASAGPDGTFGNRFDDPDATYRVLYASSQRLGCFVETLARFRIDPTNILMHGHQLAGPFLDAVDLLGTFVFALSGAAAGVKSRFDLFGLMALSFAAGNAGGITRDVLIGAVPPAAISDWRYLGVCLLAGLVTFFWYPNIDKRRRLVLLFDAAGLGLFAVAGAQKALIAGLNPVMAIFMGVLTGIGGGILRDVLVNQTPTVLEADIYAVAAIAAGVVVVIGYELHYRAFVVLTVGALLCFWLRVMAIYRGWHLPVAQSQNRRD